MVKILIAEDNIANFYLFKKIFKFMDFKGIIIHAIDGEEAVQLCKLNPDIKLILMDIRMPIMNGEEAAVKINEINPDIPIISQTAYHTLGRVDEYNKKYFVEFIEKPIDIINLINLVDKYCATN